MALWSSLKEPLIDTSGFDHQGGSLEDGSRVWYKKGSKAYLATILGRAEGGPGGAERFNLEYWKKKNHQKRAEKRVAHYGLVTIYTPEGGGEGAKRFIETDRHYLNIYAASPDDAVVSTQPGAAAAATTNNPMAGKPAAVGRGAGAGGSAGGGGGGGKLKRASMRRGLSVVKQQERKPIGSSAQTAYPRHGQPLLHRIEMLHPATFVDREPKGKLVLLRAMDVHVEGGEGGSPPPDVDGAAGEGGELRGHGMPVRMWIEADTPEDAKKWAASLKAMPTYRKPLQCVADIGDLVPAKLPREAARKVRCHFEFMPLLFATFLVTMLFFVGMLGMNARISYCEKTGKCKVESQTAPMEISWILTLCSLANVVWLMLLMKYAPDELMEGYWNFFVMFLLRPLYKVAKALRIIACCQCRKFCAPPANFDERGRAEEDDEAFLRRRNQFTFVDDDDGSNPNRLSSDGHTAGHFELTEIDYQDYYAKKHGKKSFKLPTGGAGGGIDVEAGGGGGGGGERFGGTGESSIDRDYSDERQSGGLFGFWRGGGRSYTDLDDENGAESFGDSGGRARANKGGGGKLRPHQQGRRPQLRTRSNRCLFTITGALVMGLVFGIVYMLVALPFGETAGNALRNFELGGVCGLVSGSLMAWCNPGKLQNFVTNIKKFITVQDDVGKIICGMQCRTESKALFQKVTHWLAVVIMFNCLCYGFVFHKAFCDEPGAYSGCDISWETGKCSGKCWFQLANGAVVLFLNLICTYVIYADEPCASHGRMSTLLGKCRCSCDCDVMEYFKVIALLRLPLARD